MVKVLILVQLFDQSHSVEEVLKEFSKYWKFPNDKSAYFISNDKKFYESDLLKLNCDKALSELQWSPTLDYKKTIEITGMWYNCFYNKKENILKYTINQIKDYQKTAQKKTLYGQNNDRRGKPYYFRNYY